MNTETSTEQAQAPNPSKNPPAIRFFRVLIWMSPGPAVAACGLFLTLCSNTFNTELDLATIPLALFACLSIGYFDGCLSPSTKKINGTPNAKQAIAHAVLFAFAQIILIPLLFGSLVTLLYLGAKISSFI